MIRLAFLGGACYYPYKAKGYDEEEYVLKVFREGAAGESAQTEETEGSFRTGRVNAVTCHVRLTLQSRLCQELLRCAP